MCKIFCASAFQLDSLSIYMLGNYIGIRYKTILLIEGEDCDHDHDHDRVTEQAYQAQDPKGVRELQNSYKEMLNENKEMKSGYKETHKRYEQLLSHLSHFCVFESPGSLRLIFPNSLVWPGPKFL